jgi:hypothetical protein
MAAAIAAPVRIDKPPFGEKSAAKAGLRRARALLPQLIIVSKVHWFKQSIRDISAAS